MILGIGNDLVDIARIERLIEAQGEKFLTRCFTPNEIEKARSRANGGRMAATLAKRFAAKEACAKALGSGIAGGLTFQDFHIDNNENGAPTLSLHGEAQKKLDRLTPAGMSAIIHLSLSDEQLYAQAFVVIEARMA